MKGKFLLTLALAVASVGIAVPAAQAAVSQAAMPQNIRDLTLQPGGYEPASLPCCGLSSGQVRAAAASGPANVVAWSDADMNTDVLISANFWQQQGRTLCAPVRYYLSDNPPVNYSSGGIWALSQRTSCGVYIDRDYVYAYGGARNTAGENARAWQQAMCGLMTHEMGHLAGLLHPDTSEYQMQTWVMGYVPGAYQPAKVEACRRWYGGQVAGPPVGD